MSVSNKKYQYSAIVIVIVALSVLASCGKAPAKRAKYKPYKEVGVASWYGWRMKGMRTANGEKYNPKDMTAAHRTLAFNTIVKVTNLENGNTCEVRINDRGPAKWTHRLIDLSKAAAEKLGYIKKGVAKVRVESVRY